MRKCTVTIEDKVVNAVFHMWSEYANVVDASPLAGGHPGGQIKYPVAVVEYEDGRCDTVPAYCVVFTDKAIKLKIKTVDDKEAVERISRMIKNNDGYCPCRIAKNADTKCMCKDFREQTEPGKCHCGLYEKVEE